MPVKVKKGTGKKPWKIVNKNTGKVEGTATTKKAADASARTRNASGYGKKRK